MSENNQQNPSTVTADQIKKAVVDDKAARRRATQQRAAFTYPNGRKIMIRHDPFNRSGDVYLS